ncbi:hypothetical protein [Corynebacterium renale]|uniref:Uncharacterized protein n=1 Tax=Corynebacterium renale TaxID=1724 RepID=A0A2A9DK94_9CORY|nr:hypothetical protein [Corynebacterium renale]PFG27177.1 hypothetical protein ATK06_0227 [Corynebacterium renale]SQI23861.1 Uncharacterised protein [Corynebacterium renale]
MTAGILVHPDGRTEAISFDAANPLTVVGPEPEMAAAAFSEETTSCRMVFSAAPEPGSEPNAIASLARLEAATGNSRFFLDPTQAVAGVAVFFAASEEEIAEGIAQAARAVENYKADFPQEFQLWHNAVVNLEAY